MKKGIFSLSLALSLALGSSAVMANDIWQAAESSEYGPKAGGMLARGLLNAASCFVDLVVHTVEGTEQGPPVVGTLGGIGTGAACTVLRAASGVVDVASFWIPGFNGVPVSRSYSNCLEGAGTGRAARTGAGVPARGTGAVAVAAPAPQASRTQAPTHDPAAYAKGGDAGGAHDPAKYVKK